MEIWKRVEEKGFDHYDISNLANFRDFDTKAKPEEIYFMKCKKGYNYVTLFRKGYESKRYCIKLFKVSRLVANHFIPNSQNLPTVNHIIGRNDDSASNLEWANYKQQALYRDKQKTIYGKACSSKYKGVSKCYRKWRATINNPETNKKEYLGSFDCEEEAGKAYDKRAL